MNYPRIEHSSAVRVAMLPLLTHSSERKCEAMPKHPIKWHTTSRHARGYGTFWDKLRLMVLTRDSHLCQACLSLNRVTPANQVDHIVPRAKGGSDDLSNLQSICELCHKSKTIRDNGGTPKQTIGLDGWPID